MMKNFTLKKLLKKKENILILAMFGLLFVFGCYEFSSILQPTEGNSNSTFDVSIVMKEDADGTNDWTSEAGDLMHPGLFGVLIPEGWTVTDNIAVRVESNSTDLDGDGVEQTATSDHSGDYVLVNNAILSTMLTDSVGVPEGYYWWGARAEDVDMAYLDSLYFTITVNTDDQLGEFYLQYTVGDIEYWERNPVHFKSAPMQITITPPVGINSLLNDEAISVYPNPSYGHLNIKLDAYNGEVVNYMIYDLRGREVMSSQITNSHTMLDLVKLVPGVYVIRLESGDEILTHKFLKN
jgi:hypothetical protein